MAHTRIANIEEFPGAPMVHSLFGISCSKWPETPLSEGKQINNTHIQILVLITFYLYLNNY